MDCLLLTSLKTRIPATQEIADKKDANISYIRSLTKERSLLEEGTAQYEKATLRVKDLSR
jgi:chorismate mutase